MGNSQQVYEQMVEIMDCFKKDGMSWVEKGNKTAALRARKASKQLEVLGKLFRKLSVNEAKND